VRPLRVIVEAPLLNDNPRLPQAAKDFPVQTFAPQLVVEVPTRLQTARLCRFCLLDALLGGEILEKIENPLKFQWEGAGGEQPPLIIHGFDVRRAERPSFANCIHQNYIGNKPEPSAEFWYCIFTFWAVRPEGDFY
jgi:hypothetical protein